MLKNCKIGIARHPQERERDMGHRVFSTHALSNCRIECQFEDMNRFVNFFWQFGGRFSHWISHQLPRRKASMVLKLVEKKSAQRRFSLSEWGAASGQATDSWPCRCLPSLLLGKESSLPWQGDSFPDGWTGKVFCHGEGQGQKSTSGAIIAYIHRNWLGNVRTSGQITFNFLTRASRRLYEISQPQICLCTTSNFLTNTTIGTFQAGHLGRHLANLERQEKEWLAFKTKGIERVDARSRFQINTAEWFNGAFLCMKLTHDFENNIRPWTYG